MLSKRQVGVIVSDKIEELQKEIVKGELLMIDITKTHGIEEVDSVIIKALIEVQRMNYRLLMSMVERLRRV